MAASVGSSDKQLLSVRFKLLSLGMDVFDFKILKQDLKFAKKISEILLYNYESTYEQLLKKAGGSS